MANKKRVNVSRKPIRGKKAPLGQNFLTDPGAARKIVDALGDAGAATVIEIGPGRGVLTDLLALRAGRLIAIELDRVLAAQLRMRYATRPSVEVIEANVLTVDFANVIRRRPGPLLNQGPQAPSDETLAKAHVAGNLPYYITSDILLHLFRYHTYLETIVIMVQREVAERIAARPGSRDYGLLSATAQLYAKVEKLFTLPPEAFAPPPKVHSTVLRMKVAPRFDELEVAPTEFIEFLKLAFAMKRKTLLNNLKKRYSEEQIRAALKQAGVRAYIRAEAMSLEKTAAVFKAL